MKRILVGLWLSSWCGVSVAALVTLPFAGLGAEEHCQSGYAEMCRQAELEKSIAATGQFGPEGKYVWKPGEKFLNQIAPQNYRERAGRRVQLLCTHVASSWVSKEVSEYERSTWLVAVDRQRYDECTAELLPKAITEVLKTLGLDSLKVIALVLVPVIAFLMFWYRRPLSRQIRNISKRIGGIGAD